MPASDQLERVLYILPAAAQPTGATIEDLARALGVPVQTVLDDIEEITTREYYHPAGSGELFSLSVTSDRVFLHASPEFLRPARMNEREALALGLGLRALAAEAAPDRRRDVNALARRIEATLQAPGVTLQPRQHEEAKEQQRAEEGAAVDAYLGSDDFRGAIADAIHDRRICAIEYLKPGEISAAARRVAPRRLIFANGRWYFAAFDLQRDDVRVFRMDRLLDVEALEETLRDDEVERIANIVDRNEPFVVDEDDAEVTVRYSPRIGRWIREYGKAEQCADGSVRVRYQIADPRWLVRHVLQYGGDAVVESSPYRELVAASAQAVAAQVGGRISP